MKIEKRYTMKQHEKVSSQTHLGGGSSWRDDGEAVFFFNIGNSTLDVSYVPPDKSRFATISPGPAENL